MRDFELRQTADSQFHGSETENSEPSNIGCINLVTWSFLFVVYRKGNSKTNVSFTVKGFNFENHYFAESYYDYENAIVFTLEK